MPSPPSAGNPVNVGPYKRIVAIYFPTSDALIVRFNFHVYEQEVGVECWPPTDPEDPALGDVVGGGPTSFTQLLYGKSEKTRNGIFDIIQLGESKEFADYTWTGAPPDGADLGGQTMGGAFNLWDWYDDEIHGESSTYYYVTADDLEGPPLTLFPDFTKKPQVTITCDPPTPLSEVCIFSSPGVGHVNHTYDARGTLGRSEGTPYRTVIGAFPLDFSNFEITETATGKKYKAHAISIKPLDLQDTTMGPIDVVCRYEAET